MSPVAVVVLVLVVVAAMFVVQYWRRMRANRAGTALGGVTGYPPHVAAQPGVVSSIGPPNPALPPPASVDQRVPTSGPPVQLQICGLPALAWQRAEWLLEHRQAMQLHLMVDAGVGLPFLQLYHRGAIARTFRTAPVATGIPALDQRFQASGDLVAWAPVLAQPQVTQALLAFPLNSVDVYGGRIAFESLDGVHLDPGAVQALAQIAATLVAAVPAHITSANPQAPMTARIGATPNDPDSIVRNVLAGTSLTPEQQAAALRIVQSDTQLPTGGRP